MEQEDRIEGIEQGQIEVMNQSHDSELLLLEDISRPQSAQPIYPYEQSPNLHDTVLKALMKNKENPIL